MLKSFAPWLAIFIVSLALVYGASNAIRGDTGLTRSGKCKTGGFTLTQGQNIADLEGLNLCPGDDGRFETYYLPTVTHIKRRGDPDANIYITGEVCRYISPSQIQDADVVVCTWVGPANGRNAIMEIIAKDGFEYTDRWPGGIRLSVTPHFKN